MDSLVLHFLFNKYKPFFKMRRLIISKYLRYKRWQYSTNDNIIEIVILCIERDLDTLPELVKSIHEFLLHPVKKINIIGPELPKLKEFCNDYGCNFVDQNSVLPINISDIGEYNLNGIDRRGWIFQQLLKMSADSFVNTNFYYVIDADTILISPQSLLTKSKFVLNTSDEFHEPYRLIYQRLLGELPISPISFVSHQMVFEKKTLKKLKKKIEEHTNYKWYEAIIKLIDRNEMSSFSEFELYGNFLIANYLDKVKLEYFFNISFNKEFIDNLPEIKKKYKGIYKSVSFHWYNTNKFLP